MDSYNEKVNFYLPGAFEYFQLYVKLITEFKIAPEKFKDNVNIGGVYGSPTCIWNGGRVISNCNYSEEQLEEVKVFFEVMSIPIYFTFTNSLLKEYHLYNEYGNLLLEKFNNGQNGIICNLPILENYIREKYKDSYKYISSTTKRLNNKDKQKKELSKNYDQIVLDYDFNKDFDFLKEIKSKEKIEILCNPVCTENCLYRKKHYWYISKEQLLGIPIVFKNCPCEEKELWEIMDNKNFIKPEMINSIYLPLGYKNYKIEGRTTFHYNLIETLVYYLVKNDYQIEIRQKLCQ